MRIRRLQVEADPWLPDFDGAQIARERNYKALTLAEGLAAFREAEIQDWMRTRRERDYRRGAGLED